MSDLTSRDVFESKTRPRIMRVHLETADADIFMRMFSAGDRVDLAEKWKQLDKSLGGGELNRAFGFPVIAKYLVDPAGNRLYSDEEDDQKRLAGLDAGILDEIIAQIMKINGLGATAAEEAAKN